MADDPAMSHKGKRKEGPLMELYRSSYDHIYGELRNYWMNHAFVRGLQWLGWSEAVSHLVDSSRVDDRVRMTVNRIRANQRTIMGNLTQRELTFEVIPSQPNDAAAREARMGEAVLYDLHRSQGWEVVREEHMAATAKGGTGALTVQIDPESRMPIVQARSLAEFTVEPGSRRGEFARWVVLIDALPPPVVKALFNMSKEPPADARSGLDPFQHRLLHQDFGSGSPNPPLTRVLTYYERPIRNAKGRWIVEVDGKQIDGGAWPFPFKDRLPIAVARESVEENQWFGTTYMNDVRKVQILMNQIWSGVAEHAKELATHKIIYPAGAQSYVEEMNDQPGWQPWPENVEMPQSFQPPPIDRSYENLIDRCAMAIDDIMGVHDVSRGQAPPNIESGLGISILTENDNSPTARLIKETARCWTEISRMCLQIYAEEVTEQREIIVEDDFGTEYYRHTGKDLGKQFNSIVPQDAIIPQSRAARVALADKAWQQGIIKDPVQYVEIAELPGAKNMVSAINPDVAKARRENAEMAKGIIGDVNWHKNDDHQIHIREHSRFMKSKKWEELPPEIQKIYTDHHQMHKNMRAEQQAQEIKMASVQARAEAALAPTDMSGGGGAAMMPPAGGMGPPVAGPPAGGAQPNDFLDYDELDVQDQLTGLMSMNGGEGP
jgi:hypothetical protein